jgi:hypothetical protein
LFSIPIEIIEDVIGIESSEYGDIVFEDVVNTDHTDEKEPDCDTWCKHVGHLLGTKPLDAE